jgi:hypothetical protein
MHDRHSLARPFALVCAAGGWLTADLAGLRYARSDEVLLRALLFLLTPLVAAFVGWKVAPKGAPSGARFALLPLAGGAVNGAIIGFLVAFPGGGVGGALLGPFVAVGFLPFLAPAFVAARCSQGRAGSLLAQVERRSVWGASFAGVALGTLVPRLLAHPHAGTEAWKGEVVLAGAMLIGATRVALLDLRDLALLRSMASRTLGARTARAAAETVDLGIGNGVSEEEVVAAGSYRAGGMVREYVGDPAQLSGAIRNQLVVDGLVVAATIGALALAVLAPVPRGMLEL